MPKVKLTYNINNFNSRYLNEPQSAKEYIKFSDFEKKKYKEILKILSIKLNKTHNIKCNIEFWDKLLGNFLLYHVATCNRYLNSKSKKIKQFKNYNFEILRQESFYTPFNTSDYRNCFQHSDFGQEQMFSMLIRFFFKNQKFKDTKKEYGKKNFKIQKQNKKKLSFKYLFYRIPNFFFRKIYKDKIKILVTNCYWANEIKHKMQFRFRGKLLYKNFYIPRIESLLNFDLRKKIFKVEKLKYKVDNFDNFFFYTLKFCMPKSFIEEFQYKSKFINNYLNKNKDLRIIINEALDEDSMFLIAFAKLKKIKSIYTEHNYLQLQFIGNIIEFITKKFDLFLTIGWKSKNIKLISAGSFYNWINGEDEIKEKYPILFVDGVSVKRAPFSSSAYGESGDYNSKNYVKMNQIFFNSLKKEVLKKIWIKKYPDNFKKTFCYNPIDKKIYSSKIIHTNKIKESNINFGNYVASAEMIITNYLSTSYIQALISNKPTVIFFNSKSYFLTNKHKDFFKELIKNNIMHEDPKDAANFINENYDNLNRWWFSPLTQRARKNFLKNNIKDTNNMYNVITKLLKKNIQ